MARKKRQCEPSVAPERPSEKRSGPRFYAKKDFMVEFRKGWFNQRWLGEGRDVSLEGARFVTPVRLKEQERLNVLLHLPSALGGQEKVELEAEVIRVYKPSRASRYRIGCRLVHKYETTKKQIQRFLDWLQPNNPFNNEP